MSAGRVHVAGCPADVSHGAVRGIEVEVIASASTGPWGSSGMLWWQRLEPVTHLGGTDEQMTRVYDA
jgi:hypothetical protein